MYKYMYIPCIYNNMYIIYHLFVSSLCFCLCISFPSLPLLSLSLLSLSLFLPPLLSFTLSLLSSFLLAWPQHYFLRGHKRRVTSLLYPCDYSSAYDNNHLLSGGADFSVRLWDLYKGILLHTFAVHGGVVSSIVTCPPDINVSPALSLSLIKTYITLANTCTCVFVVAPNTIAH